MTEARGWPFLIGAGRRNDYRTLVAPDFLTGYGVLDRYAGRIPEGETRVARIGPGLWIAYETRSVPDVRDEHNRPLQVFVGFVADAAIDRPDPADLEAAVGAATPDYRRYLDDEDSFDVARSAAFTLRTPVRPAEPDTRSKLWWIVAVVLGGVLVAVVALIIFLTTRSPEPACVPPPGSEVCQTPATELIQERLYATLP